jgi:uncharacterized protein (UPF0332 family)
LTPQAAAFLAKGDKALREGRAMLEAGFNEAAGRSAYLAAFHAAQALVFERIGRVLKTHHGVGNEFLRLTKEEAGVDAPLRIFLSQAYNLKAIADYEIGPWERDFERPRGGSTRNCDFIHKRSNESDHSSERAHESPHF